MQYANIALLVVDKEDAYARTRAQKLGIPCVFMNPKQFKNKALYETAIIKYLKQYQIDFIALAGYMRFIGDVLLQAFPRAIVNLHPAYLPAFPGAHSIIEAYEAKVSYSGVTLHYVDEGIDTGEIIKQEKVPLHPKMSFGAFERSIHKKEYEMYPRVLDSVCKEVRK